LPRLILSPEADRESSRAHREERGGVVRAREIEMERNGEKGNEEEDPRELSGG
jgi:hypothetical protein